MYQFNGIVFVPGHYYVISIVTVSGTTYVKKSSEHTEWIRTNPTKPNPPTNLLCPQSPLDISLEISWTAPTEPNGLIFRYQIDVSQGNLQVNTSSNETQKNVEGLLPVSSAPRNLNIDGIQSRGFRIQFNRPDNVNDILAAYKIVISEGGKCVQQILVHGICSICKSTVGCPSPINYTVPDITNNDVSYTATGLNPYTLYVVKVVAINGVGEGRPVNEIVRTDEEGFETKMLSVTGLEEYWPYKFQVNAATVKGNRTSDFSSVFKTKEAVVKDDETTSTSSIIGSVVAVILVVAVVVIGIFIWKRNQRHKENKEQAITYADLNLDERTKRPTLFIIGARKSNCKQQVDDFNRVRLSSPGASDYINASVLLDKCYILTSYPIAKTFGNFWQMVWEQNVSTIVVMTGHSDDRESWYFSDNEGTVRTMERIDVELLAKFKSSESVTMRKIKLSRLCFLQELLALLPTLTEDPLVALQRALL
uniref:Receptor-type tyrosine-protein phosphatase N2 n=1 Tax=Magallana gigas TaxID=29159 RepID=K1RD42_MAGGI